MDIKKTILVDANFYIGNKNCFATASEVTAPELKPKKIEFETMASIGTVKLPSGKFEALECKVKLTGFSPEVFEEVADTMNTVEVMVYSDIVEFNGDTVYRHIPAKLFMTCSASAFKVLGDKKGHENPEQEISFDVSAFTLEIDGKIINKVDYVNNILIVNGKDLRKEVNANLGI